MPLEIDSLTTDFEKGREEVLGSEADEPRRGVIFGNLL
jgi:hypothetical protein